MACCDAPPMPTDKIYSGKQWNYQRGRKFEANFRYRTPPPPPPSARAVALLCVDPTQSSETGKVWGLR